jgi:hypothetical protein
VNYKQFMENQRRLQEKLSGDVARDRAAFLKRPPLAPERNPLLGRWRLDQAKKRPANALAELNAAISAPTCRAVFGDGIWDFRPQALWGHDAGIGESKLFDADYRSGGGLIGVLPRQSEGLFVFEVKGPDRIEERTSTRIGADACAFVRVRTPAAAAATAAVPPGAGAATAPTGGGGIVDGAAFRCADGRLLHVSFCQGEGPDAQCKLSDLHLPGLQMGKQARRADIAARVAGCEAGGIRYGQDDKPVFVR